jgi:hypothetical protein
MVDFRTRPQPNFLGHDSSPPCSNRLDDTFNFKCHYLEEKYDMTSIMSVKGCRATFAQAEVGC